MKYIKLSDMETNLKCINSQIKLLNLDLNKILELINNIKELESLLAKEYNSNNQYNISRERIDIVCDCLNNIIYDLSDLYVVYKENSPQFKQSVLDFTGIPELIKISNRNYFEPYYKWVESKSLEYKKKNAKYRRDKRRDNFLGKTSQEIEKLERFILCNYWKKQGLRNYQIARKLNISPKTVKNHLENIYNIKLDTDCLKTFSNNIIERERAETFEISLEDDELVF